MDLKDPDFEKYSSSQCVFEKNPMKNERFTISIDRWIVDYPSLGIKRHIVS